MWQLPELRNWFKSVAGAGQNLSLASLFRSLRNSKAGRLNCYKFTDNSWIFS